MNLCNEIVVQLSSAALYAWWQVAIAGLSALGVGLFLGFADHARFGNASLAAIFYHCIVAVMLVLVCLRLPFESQMAVFIAWGTGCFLASAILTLRAGLKFLAFLSWFVVSLFTKPASLANAARKLVAESRTSLARHYDRAWDWADTKPKRKP